MIEAANAFIAAAGIVTNMGHALGCQYSACVHVSLHWFLQQHAFTYNTLSNTLCL